MLDIADQNDLVPAWHEVDSRAALPVAPQEFLAKEGPTPVLPMSRRSFHRMHFRTTAVLRYQDEFHAGYLVDLSRSGVGLISPVQLLPAAELELWLPDGRHLNLRAIRCVRVAAHCYHCGAEFAKS